MGEKTKVSWSIDAVVAAGVVALAAAEHRSVSSMASRLLEAGLGGGDRGGSDALQGAAAVHLSGRGREPREDGASPPPSPETLDERDGVAGQRATAALPSAIREDAGSSRSSSASHFKPDPKPGKH